MYKPIKIGTELTPLHRHLCITPADVSCPRHTTLLQA